MGDLVNLNKARKARAKAAAQVQAAANRVLHGRTSAGKAADAAARSRRAALLDGARLESAAEAGGAGPAGTGRRAGPDAP